ncbi:MAG: HRDC domain-containing protein [Thermodesulfobacteriota bacterium]|nr:HRDC domain-containing protein [Thermodesulfobacteriota bacterium]
MSYKIILEHSSNEPYGLTKADRLCYERLRAWRKERAEKEGVPPFVIAKNSHLSEIVRKEIKTLEALKEIHPVESAPRLTLPI